MAEEKAALSEHTMFNIEVAAQVRRYKHAVHEMTNAEAVLESRGVYVGYEVVNPTGSQEKLRFSISVQANAGEPLEVKRRG